MGPTALTLGDCLADAGLNSQCPQHPHGCLCQPGGIDGRLPAVPECDEIARIAAPVYFKIEPGSSEGALYNTWVDPNYLDHLARERVKIAQICIEWVERCGKNIVFNDYKEDLSIPQP